MPILKQTLFLPLHQAHATQARIVFPLKVGPARRQYPRHAMPWLSFSALSVRKQWSAQSCASNRALAVYMSKITIRLTVVEGLA